MEVLVILCDIYILFCFNYYIISNNKFPFVVGYEMLSIDEPKFNWRLNITESFQLLRID